MLAMAAFLLVVGWDGADHRVVSEMLAAGDLPNLAALTSTGTFEELEITSGRTQTATSWTTFFSGVPEYIHKTRANDDQRPWPPAKTVFGRAAREGVPAAWVANKSDIVGDHPGFSFEGLTQHLVYYGATNTFATNLDEADVEIRAEKRACKAGLRAIAEHSTDGRAFLFCHFAYPDRFGHLFNGAGSDEYRGALRLLDAVLGGLVRSAPGATFVLISDHGFEWPEREVQVLPRFRDIAPAWGWGHWFCPHAIIGSNVPLVIGRATSIDVFKTLLAIVGVSAPPYPAGRSLVE